MKHFFKTLTITAFVALSMTACQSPTTSNGSTTNPSANPTVAPSTGTGVTGNLATKASFIAFLNCVKTKVPQEEGNIQAHITALANVTEQQWTTTNSAYYVSVAQQYSTAGCN